MSWFKRSDGNSRDEARAPEIAAATPSRFRVEAFEPRLLLSGDPLDLIQDSLQAPLLPEPVVVVEVDDSQAGSTATPTIDWGADASATDPAQQADPSDGVTAAPVPGPVETDQPVLATDIATVAATEVQVAVATDSPVTTAAGSESQAPTRCSDPVVSQVSYDHDARGPPDSEEGNLLVANGASDSSSEPDYPRASLDALTLLQPENPWQPITVDQATLDLLDGVDAIAVGSAQGSHVIEIGDVALDASLTIFGSGHTTTISGTVSFAGDQTYNDAIVIDGSVTIEAGGDLVFGFDLPGTITGAGAGDHDLTLLAGGEVVITGAVGGNGLRNLVVQSGRGVRFDSTVQLNGSLSVTNGGDFRGDQFITTGGPITLDTIPAAGQPTTGNITLLGAVTTLGVASDITIQRARDVGFASTVDATGAVALGTTAPVADVLLGGTVTAGTTFSSAGAGFDNLGAPISTDGDLPIDHSGAVTIRATLTAQAGAGAGPSRGGGGG